MQSTNGGSEGERLVHLATGSFYALSPIIQALLWEFDTVTLKTVGSALYQSANGPVPTVGAQGADYVALTTNISPAVTLDPAK